MAARRCSGVCKKGKGYIVPPLEEYEQRGAKDCADNAFRLVGDQSTAGNRGA